MNEDQCTFGHFVTVTPCKLVKLSFSFSWLSLKTVMLILKENLCSFTSAGTTEMSQLLILFMCLFNLLFSNMSGCLDDVLVRNIRKLDFPGKYCKGLLNYPIKVFEKLGFLCADNCGALSEITLHDVCAVHWGYAVHRGCSVHWGISWVQWGNSMNTRGCSVHWGVIVSTPGRYREYTGWCSVHWGIS